MCNRAIRVDEKCVKALVHRSSARMALTQYDDAISDLEKAIELSPSNTETVRLLEIAKATKAENEREARALTLAESQVLDRVSASYNRLICVPIDSSSASERMFDTVT